MAERMLAAAKRDEDQPDAALRPQTLAEFIGQEKVRSNLKVFIDAARARREALDHVLFAGRRVSARRRSPRSWPGSSASISAPPRAR